MTTEERMQGMENYPFEDEQPNIEGPTLTIGYDAHVDLNYADRNGFDTRWAAETHQFAAMNNILKSGDKFVSMVYTYRSISKALPTVKSADQANKDDIYQASYDVLLPEIQKLKDLMNFQTASIKTFCDNMKRIIPAKGQEPPTEQFLWYMVRLMDLFAVLNSLKNIKASLNNDNSFYKRALGFIRKTAQGPDDQTQENHLLGMFLANQDSITNNLKTEVNNVAGFEDAMIILVNQCADWFEQKRYLLPSDKHMLLRVMPYCFFVMDTEKFNIYKDKRFKIQRFVPIFKSNPIVPLYGDMQTNLELLHRKCPHFDPALWATQESEMKKVQMQYEVVYSKDQTRSQHDSYYSKFYAIVSQARRERAQTGKDPASKETCHAIMQLTLDGLHLMSSLNAAILEQAAWKYSRPNNGPDTPPDALDYERVIKLNYSPDERMALVEYIGMLKGLAATFIREESLIAPIVNRAIHEEVQVFIQRKMRDLIRQVSKSKKKGSLRNDLLQLRTLAADWDKGVEPVDASLYGKKVDIQVLISSQDKNEKLPPIPDRATAPSWTQLELIRSLVYAAMEPGEKKREFGGSDHRLLAAFYHETFFYQYLMDLPATVARLSDLGDLWYREFYIDLSKRLQFPIEMSLPWILTNHILDNNNPAMEEFILYPLDIYNDAAQRALTSLDQQFLFDEVEAEVNLAFDQFVYKLSEQVYTHYKTAAAVFQLDKPYSSKLQLEYSPGKFAVPKARFAPLLKQRHFQLLGRNIDLNSLVAQRMNTYLRDNLELSLTSKAIRRFEASDITGVIELETLLENIRLVYGALTEHFELEPFETMYSESNDSSSLTSLHGRIILHLIFELVSDFAPNFSFNSVSQRWVRSSVNFSQDVQRDPMPRERNPALLFGTRFINLAFSMGSQLQKGFFGSPHLAAIMRLVGRAKVPLLVGELCSTIELKMQRVLAPYFAELMGGMPPQTKLPIYDYGTEGNYGYFNLSFQQILAYSDLRPEVFQTMREVGNYLIFLRQLDSVAHQYESNIFTLTAPFLGITRDNIDNMKSIKESPIAFEISQLCGKLENTPGSARAPDALRDIIKNAERAADMYKPSSEPMSLYVGALRLVEKAIAVLAEEWNGPPPENGVLNIDATTEFYRLYSALQFIFCMPQEGMSGLGELFGDSVSWAGTTIIYFLRQRELFETFDPSYHILNIEEAASAPVAKPEIAMFCKNVSFSKDISEQLFAELASNCPLPEREDLVVLKPPEQHFDDQFIAKS